MNPAPLLASSVLLGIMFTYMILRMGVLPDGLTPLQGMTMLVILWVGLTFLPLAWAAWVARRWAHDLAGIVKDALGAF